MSGIEVAGIALAVFPILINGLNHVVAGIETAKRWKRYRVKLKDYADILESASVYFLDTLDELLSDIVHSEEELLLLLENPGGSLWKDIKYEGRLRSRLDRSYNSYLKTVTRLVQALQGMCDRLGVDNVGSVKWDDYSTLEREMHRVKLTFSKSVYKDLLDDIRRANQDLREFTHQNIALEPKKHQRRARSAIADLKLIRRHAASLYQVLINDKTWKCECGMHHLASLRLEARPQISQDLKLEAGAIKAPTFRMLLSVAKIDGDSTGHAQWQDIEILPSLGNQPLIAPSTARLNSNRLPSSLPRSRVTFALETDRVDTRSHQWQASAERKSKHIEDLCSALCAPDTQEREIGALIDQVERQEHKIYRANTNSGLPTCSRSLEDLLGATKALGAESLSRKDRLGIAVILASSVLQLDGTSWLKSGWSSNDIYFHYKDSQISQQPQPYLSWQRCCNTNVSCPMVSLRIAGNHMIRNEILLALGLTLVELCFGRTLTDLRRPEDIGIDETASRLATATRLHARVYDEMGIPYGDVVRRCLFQLFDVRELRLDIEEVQQKVFDTVVTPLVHDLNNFNGVLSIR
ncbi:MAG: hypothetical protein Q9169_003576 [Polycauliona sp. 2 TL-2023]